MSATSGKTARPAHCPKHGAFVETALYERLAGCPSCRADARAAEQARQEEAEHQARLERRLDLAGLRGRFRTATFDTFEATTAAKRRALESCRTFAAEGALGGAGGLWLLGPPGGGKTHLLAATVHAVVVQRHRTALLTSPRAIVRRIRNAWHRDAEETEGAAIARFVQPELLALDEVGISSTDGELAHLFDVLDARYQDARPTLLASNLNVSQLREALGDRLFDRLREGASTVPCDWPSRRLPAEARP
ncbi:MAG: ATP-binding protein [Burkholderiales bacterium]|nr:ATP-binding protein [Burkholderiales bacterium]